MGTASRRAVVTSARMMMMVPAQAVHVPSRRSSVFSTSMLSNRYLTTLRGGDADSTNKENNNMPTADAAAAAAHDGTTTITTTDTTTTTHYETLAQPSPGSPFHYAFPVHDLQAAKYFYGTVLGCQEGRSSTKWQDYSLHGHQIVAHWVGDDYRCIDYYNPVDGDEVPVPHTGLALTVDQFHALAERVKSYGIPFIIPPHLRFQGMPGEQ
jgi:extradiol dioxygenase family protein